MYAAAVVALLVTGTYSYTGQAAIEDAMISPAVDLARDPDAALMLAVKADAPGAFDELHRRYRRRVEAFLSRSLGHHQVSDDLCQEVFLRVYRGRHGYQATSPFSSWLFTIAANVASNSKRAMARRREVPASVDELPEGSTAAGRAGRDESPVATAERNELRRAVRGAIQRLNGRQRMAMQLAGLDELSHQQVARRLRVSPQAIKSMLCRARVQLRDLLETSVCSHS